MTARRFAALAACAALAPLAAACADHDAGYAPKRGPYGGVDAGAHFSNIGYATWRDDEPDYRLYPGDQIDVAAPSAPELNRTVVVQPDGRVALPLIGPVMAADRSAPQLEGVLTQAYGRQLYDPRIEVSVHAATPLRIFVGGEVGKPGVYDMPGDIDSLQAVVMAGGFNPTANPHEVIVIRRGPDGRPMMRHVDLGSAIRHAPTSDAVPLRRFDVVFVPRSGIANADLFVDQFLRGLVPVQFSYATGASGFLTTR